MRLIIQCGRVLEFLNRVNKHTNGIEAEVHKRKMENVLTQITVQFENENGKQGSFVMRISLNRYIAEDSMQNKVQKNIA